MQLRRLGGLSHYFYKRGRPMAKAEKVEAIYRANGSISSGAAVMLTTSNPTGCIVQPCTAADDHAIIGIYEGKTGDPSTTANNPGGLLDTPGIPKRPSVGTTILVTVYGIGYCVLEGTVLSGNTLRPTAGATLEPTAAPPAEGLVSCLIAMDDGDGVSAKPVFVKLM